jgi:hypothetical protein
MVPNNGDLLLLGLCCCRLAAISQIMVNSLLQLSDLNKLTSSTHLGLKTRFFFSVWQLQVCWCGASPLTRGLFCLLQCTVYNLFTFYMLWHECIYSIYKASDWTVEVTDYEVTFSFVYLHILKGSFQCSYPCCCLNQLNSRKHPLPYSASFSFNPHQEVIFSFHNIIWLHSLVYENACCVFFMFLP